MNITNISISRVIAHEVVRASGMSERPPILSDELPSLDDSGKVLIGKRLVATMALGNHSVEVTVEDASTGSPFDHATSMLDSTDNVFIEKSKHLARSLSLAQTVGQIKSGSVIFIQGNCVIDGTSSRYISIIKADSDEGLAKQVTNTGITLKLVRDMLLGESQRLFKVAFIVEDNEPRTKPDIRDTGDFSIMVFDHLMQNTGDGNAAAYFYRAFLKCRLAENAARKTKQFYELAKDFVSSLAISQDKKVELRGNVIAYLQSNQGTLEPRSFARTVLPTNQQDAFIRRCTSDGFTQAVVKDLTLLKGKLRRQSVKFTSKVTLYASPEVFRDSVKIGKSTDGWTEIKIKGSVDEIP
ncbi:MAG: nucleoid-associated protein [Puniceicoccales bacterium]|jgi:hypothetical protein|nr:nucleoid-associated protein [Puniceicoccales bacterium]